MTGQERNIIDNEFSDMEVIDTKEAVKHDYKDKTRKREKLEKKEEEGIKKVQIWVREETLEYERELTRLQIELLKFQNYRIISSFSYIIAGKRRVRRTLGYW